MPVKTVIGPKTRPDGTTIPLSAAVQAGDFMFLSGQLAMSPEGKITGDDITAQAQKTLENIDATLTQLGLTKADICKATVWLKNAKDFPAFNKVYAAYFGEVAPPARSTVQAELMDPTALIEIEMVAYLGG